jgi:hypothetical protein
LPRAETGDRLKTKASIGRPHPLGNGEMATILGSQDRMAASSICRVSNCCESLLLE